mmetsp:Transcript_26466/g.47505  ORF Transcript_26466/g.47505 Transcript_26466/m.47505 type:complete len:164 (+) Transcript_26466:2717-3208(+)
METNSRFVEFCQTVSTFLVSLINSLQSKNYMTHMKGLSLEHYVQLDMQVTYLINLFKCNFSTAFLQFIQKYRIEESLGELNKAHTFERVLHKQESYGINPDILRELPLNVLDMEPNSRVVKKFLSKLEAQKAELEAQCAKLEKERQELQTVIYELRTELVNVL